MVWKFCPGSERTASRGAERCWNSCNPSGSIGYHLAIRQSTMMVEKMQTNGVLARFHGTIIYKWGVPISMARVARHHGWLRLVFDWLESMRLWHFTSLHTDIVPNAVLFLPCWDIFSSDLDQSLISHLYPETFHWSEVKVFCAYWYLLTDLSARSEVAFQYLSVAGSYMRSHGGGVLKVAGS